MRKQNLLVAIEPNTFSMQFFREHFPHKRILTYIKGGPEPDWTTPWIHQSRIKLCVCFFHCCTRVFYDRCPCITKVGYFETSSVCPPVCNDYELCESIQRAFWSAEREPIGNRLNGSIFEPTTSGYYEIRFINCAPTCERCNAQQSQLRTISSLIKVLLHIVCAPYSEAWWPSCQSVGVASQTWRVRVLVATRNFLGQGIHSHCSGQLSLLPTQDGKWVPASAGVKVLVCTCRAGE